MVKIIRGKNGKVMAEREQHLYLRFSREEFEGGDGEAGGPEHVPSFT